MLFRDLNKFMAHYPTDPALKFLLLRSLSKILIDVTVPFPPVEKAISNFSHKPSISWIESVVSG